MPDGPSYEQLIARNAELELIVVEQANQIGLQADRIAQLERRLSADSSNSSRPPSSDPPWDKDKRAARRRSSRKRSGRKPGKQPGADSSSRPLVGDPDWIVKLEPQRCRGCDGSLAGATVAGCERRQVVDIKPPPPPEVTEYQRIFKTCSGCGVVTEAGWDTGDQNAEIVAAPGSPVRIGPHTLACAALLTCAHYLPVGRCAQLLLALSSIKVSVGWLAGVAGRGARRLEKRFIPHLRQLLATAPVCHADETTGRAGGSLSYAHVVCTDYLTHLHVGDRSAATIDAGGVLPEYSGVLVGDGYAGYAHLPAVHAWCAAHLLRDLRSISDADPDHQQWATAMADVLLDAHKAVRSARDQGADTLDKAMLAAIRNHYLGALAHGRDENTSKHSTLAKQARTLITRFTRYEDMILRFATDLSVPFTNNEAERAVRPVKIEQRTSGGAWRTLQGLTDFAIMHSYLDTAHKWGIDKLDALQKLFTAEPWLPPSLAPS